MRISPKQILHGLLYAAPVILLTLASCGGGGGGSSTTTPPAPSFTVGGTITGAANGTGPILQNNGGDDLFIPTLQSGVPVAFTFSTPVTGSYTVTQLSHARSPGQNCNAITPKTGTASSSSAASGVTITCTLANIVPKYAYVTNSTANTVSAYTISTSGVLAASTTPTTATGAEPYSVSVDPTGRFAYVANHSGNSISAYIINQTSGALGTQTTIAAGTYPISVTVHPSGKFAYAVNQSSNSISAYSINTTTGALSAIDADAATAGTQATIATGASPYAVTIDPTGYFAYVANYGDGSTLSTISAYSINQTSGALTPVVNSPFPAGVGPSSIAIDPHDKFLLVTNTVSGDIFSYTIASGALTKTSNTLTGTFAPRSVAIDPTGAYAYVANAGVNSVSAYTINASTWALTPVSGSPFTAGAAPFSVNVDPSGQFVYVANFGVYDNATKTVTAAGSVSAYSIGSGGALTAVAGSPFATVAGSNSTSVTTTQ